jgi:hypothetical protein
MLQHRIRRCGETNARASVGELSALLPSWCLHLEAANLSLRTPSGPTRTRGAPGRPGQAGSFIAAELERTAPSSAATRYRSLRQLSSGLKTRRDFGVPMTEHDR